MWGVREGVKLSVLWRKLSVKPHHIPSLITWRAVFTMHGSVQRAGVPRVISMKENTSAGGVGGSGLVFRSTRGEKGPEPESWHVSMMAGCHLKSLCCWFHTFLAHYLHVTHHEVLDLFPTWVQPLIETRT